jgi:hypothetical protein
MPSQRFSIFSNFSRCSTNSYKIIKRNILKKYIFDGIYLELHTTNLNNIFLGYFTNEKLLLSYFKKTIL